MSEACCFVADRSGDASCVCVFASCLMRRVTVSLVSASLVRMGVIFYTH